MITINHTPSGVWTRCDKRCYKHSPPCDPICREDICYLIGLRPNRYPVPALLMDSCSDLGVRWSEWMDANINNVPWPRY